MRSMNCAIAVCLGFFLSLPAAAAPGDSDVTIKNDSSWVLTELYLSSVDDEEWGPDQLGTQVVGSEEEFTLTDVPCDIYDIRLVDEDDDVCILNDVKLCANAAEWHIRDSDLLSCQAETDE